MNSRFILCSALLTAAVLAGPTVTKRNAKIDVPSNVILNLYTQGNPLISEYVTLDDSTSPSFNPKNPTRIVIHGYNTTKIDRLFMYREAYLATGQELNIILVDWTVLSLQDVPQATADAVRVGDYVGGILQHLIDSRGLKLEDLIVLGNSMGAHIAGIVGNRLGGRNGPAEVVAMDPANDPFNGYPLEDQLDPSDGRYVQVLHTNVGGLGVTQNRGDVDFYFNGGYHQVGCPPTEEEKDPCSHIRSNNYFAESVNSKQFIATKCSNYDDYIKGVCSSNEHVVVGAFTPINVTGKFYLNTNSESPFAQGRTDL